ncbi:MAG: T9SS type A sorting domain-containing protein [Candidatus Latescibacteria bacterium]|nr:T9SS type A sorting domain-containing protein [Candidatus Latescibacterota bacterium]
MTYIPKDADFQFKWSTVAGATEYLFWWSGDGINWQSAANAGTTLSWNLVEDHPADIPFRWKVQAKVAGGYTANSSEWRLYDVPASPPIPTAPGDLSYMAPNTTWTYTWGVVSGASEYELSESTNGGVSWTPRTVLTNSAASPAGGLPGTYTTAAPFYWKLRAKIGSRYTGYSAVRRLYTQTPAAPALLLPVDLAYVAEDVGVTYRWAAVPGATGYVLEWSADDFVTTTPVVAATNSASVTLPNAYPANSPVKWRVKANLGGGFFTGYSDARRVYTVVAAPPTPTAPSDLAYVAHDPFTYSWSAVPGATGYQLEIDGVPTSYSASTTSVAVPVGLAIDIDSADPLRWRVRAVIGTQYTGWSAVRRLFTVLPDPPAVQGPVDLGFVPKNTSYKFYWTPVIGATGYRLQWTADEWAHATSVVVPKNEATLNFSVDAPITAPIKWRVQAQFGLTYSTNFSDPEAHVYTVRLVPNPTAPADLGHIDAGPTLLSYTWDALPLATEYEVEVKLGNAGTWTAVGTVTAPATSLAIGGGTMPGPYTAADPLYWRVRAKVSGQYTNWSTQRRLYTVLPQPPSLSSPADLSYMPIGTWTYRWAAVPGATQYKVEESTDGTTWTTRATVAVPMAAGPAVPGSYPLSAPLRWRVSAEISGSYRTPSAVWRLYTAPLQLQGPDEMAYAAQGQDFTYSWSAIPDAEAYEIQESTNNGVTWNSRPLITGPSPANSLLVSGGLAGAHPITSPVAWRVRAKVNGQFTRWSAVRRFFTQLPAVPSLVTPAALAYIPENVGWSYRWSSVPGAAEYQVEESADGGSTWTLAATVTTNYATKVGGLANPYPISAAYRWRVRAKVAGAYRGWSAEGQIYTVALLTSPSAPVDLYHTALHTGWTYSWSAVAGASLYELQTSTNGGTTWSTITVTAPTTSYAETAGLPVDYQVTSPFRWRVRAKIGTQYTAWSGIRRIYTVLPDAPTLVTPPTPGFIPQNVAWTYRWTSVPAATEYEVEVKAGNAGTWTNFATVTTNSAPAAGLSALYTVNSPYRWRVRAKVGTGYTGYSLESIIYTTPPVASLATGLVLHYTFNGNANDQSGNGGPDATVHGATVTSSRFGNVNAAYAFDGGASYISMDGALNQPFKTIAFWAKTDETITTSVAHHLLGEDVTGTGVHMGPYTGAVNNEIVSLSFDGGALHWDNNSFPVGIDQLWKHYVFVWQESFPYGYKLYVDGVEKGFPDVKTGVATGASTYIRGKQWNFGRFGSSSSDGWLGRIGDLKVWSRTLTVGEIAALYVAAKPVADAAGGVTPASLLVAQNAPNPFNPSTTIAYTLDQGAEVTITVFNMIGHQVAVLQHEHLPAGTHAVKWDASGLASGVYFYRIQAGAFSETRKMLLSK